MISNRIEFLDHEKAALLQELVKSKVKDEVLLKKKIKIEKQEQEDKFQKNDDLNSINLLR